MPSCFPPFFSSLSPSGRSGGCAACAAVGGPALCQVSTPGRGLWVIRPARSRWLRAGRCRLSWSVAGGLPWGWPAVGCRSVAVGALGALAGRCLARSSGGRLCGSCACLACWALSQVLRLPRVSAWPLASVGGSCPPFEDIVARFPQKVNSTEPLTFLRFLVSLATKTAVKLCKTLLSPSCCRGSARGVLSASEGRPGLCAGAFPRV